MPEFEYPWFFLLLIPYALILYYAWGLPEPAITVPGLLPFRRAGRGRRFPDYRKLIPFLLYAVAGILLTTALARPRLGVESVRSRAEGIDIILAVDLSGSMNAIDAPDAVSGRQIGSMLQNGMLKNRLETAKQEIEHFIEKRPNDRIGLIAFAERPYVVCPPTLDHAFLLANLKRLEPGVIGDGTGIAGPVASAVKRLKESDAKSRIVVLFTDGANTAPTQVTPREAAKLADTFKITVYTVGIGSGNAYMPVSGLFGGGSYQPYPGQFDEPLMKEIASITGGRYYRAADASGMAQAMSEIDKLEKTSAEQPVMVNWREFYPELLWLALGCLLLGFLLPNTVLLKAP